MLLFLIQDTISRKKNVEELEVGRNGKRKRRNNKKYQKEDIKDGEQKCFQYLSGKKQLKILLSKDTFITCNIINIILLGFYFKAKGHFKVYNDKPNSMLNEFKTFNAHYAITTIKVVYFIYDLTSGLVANYKTNFPFNALQEIQFPSQLKVQFSIKEQNFAM